MMAQHLTNIGSVHHVDLLQTTGYRTLLHTAQTMYLLILHVCRYCILKVLLQASRRQCHQRKGSRDVKGVVNCQNSQDKGPPEGNSARG